MDNRPTIVWNQLGKGEMNVSNCTRTYNNGYTTCVLTNGTSTVRMSAGYQQRGFSASDKILIISHVPEYHVANAPFRHLQINNIFNLTKTQSASTVSHRYRSNDTIAVILSVNDITEPTDICGFFFDLYYTTQFEHTTDDYFVASYMVFNLTKMFGEGDEPTSVEQFQQWFTDNIGPLDTYYPYNAGQEIKVKYLPKDM